MANFKVHRFLIYCIPEKRGYYGSRKVIVRVRRDFLVFNLQATFLLGFLLNFASGLLWQRSDHPIVLVGQEPKLGSGESKMSKIYYCLCSSCSAQFLSDLLYPQTKVGDILDSGPSRRRRRRRNFLVDAITQKQINIFFSNLVHMLRVPKGRSLF